MSEPSNEPIQVKKNANLTGALSWRNDLFYFDGADIYAVMRQLWRWYDVDFKFEGAPPTRRLQGTMGKNLPLSTVLKGIEKMIECKRQYIQTTITVKQ